MQRPQLYRCTHEEIWRREIGDLSPTSFSHRMGGCQDLIQRLQLYAKLDGHDGCVNTVHFNPSGELLVSGSDDRDVMIWDWAAKIKKFSFCSGHDSNVFQAKVMPFSDDRHIVSCAADGQVRHAQILEGGGVDTKKLAKHQGRAHKLAIEPGSPRLFYSCGEDGVVRHFDLRASESRKLFTCHTFAMKSGRRTGVIRLNAIVINPRNPHYFAVGGSDEYARVYDIRKVCSNVCGMEDIPVDTFTPKHLIGSDQVHITCVAFSLQQELLVSYNDELIYLFDKDNGMGPNPEATSAENESTFEYGPQVYTGHRNAQTVKGVNFFGPNSEYVVSGSDCGRIFIWKKRGGVLVALMLGDDRIVNCLEPHPYATILATSGIDKNVKVWAPISECLLPLPPDAEKVMEMNRCGREDQTSFPLPVDVITYLLRLHRQHTSQRDHHYSSINGDVEEEEDNDADDDDENNDDDDDDDDDDDGDDAINDDDDDYDDDNVDDDDDDDVAYVDADLVGNEISSDEENHINLRF